MPKYTTKILALVNGSITEFRGPNIDAISWSHAIEYCERNGLGYCQVDGILTSEIDEDGKITDYTNLN